jgi:hypothetical protein
MLKEMRSIIVMTSLAVLLIALVPQFATAGVDEGIAYLKARQNTDGGFSEPGESSERSLTSWALLAGLSATQVPSWWHDAGEAAVKYIYSSVNELTGLADIELYTLALSEAGADPRNVSGKNLVSLIKAHMGEDGEIGKSIDEHCWGVIALVSAGEKVPAKSTGWLVAKQREDGGWGDSDADLVRCTALGIEALVSAGEADAEIMKKALKCLRDRMGSDGGFVGTSGTSDGQLTATVVRAIYAAGDIPTSASWTFHGSNPVSFLNSLQAPDGYYRYSSGVDSQPAMTTAMVLPALAGKHLPLGVKGAKVPPGGEQSDGQPVHDLGTAGARAEAGSSEKDENKKAGSTSDGPGQKSGVPGISGVGGVSAGAFGKRETWFSGLWVFLMICVAYVVTLVIVTAIAVSMASRKRLVPPTDYGF